VVFWVSLISKNADRFLLLLILTKILAEKINPNFSRAKATENFCIAINRLIQNQIMFATDDVRVGAIRESPLPDVSKPILSELTRLLKQFYSL
jgi:hypothetical protein